MRYVGDKFRARLARRIQKLLVRLSDAEMYFVLWGEKRGFVMIEPPGQFFGRRVLEIDDRILVTVKHLLVKQVTRAMQQTGVLDLRFGMDLFLIKACEGGGRGDAGEAVAVIKQAQFHLGLMTDWESDSNESPQS